MTGSGVPLPGHWVGGYAKVPLSPLPEVLDSTEVVPFDSPIIELLDRGEWIVISTQGVPLQIFKVAVFSHYLTLKNFKLRIIAKPVNRSR